jgi:hypothetical protein
MNFILWEGLTNDERLQLMLKVHFGRSGNIEDFVDKLECSKCYDYGKVRYDYINRKKTVHRNCIGKNLKGWDIVKCMKEQAQEPIDTLYMPDTK